MPDPANLIPGALVFLLSVISVRLSRTIALRNALLDHPNERSSHRQPVPRLGGAAFIPLVFLGLLLLWWSAPMATSVKVAYSAGTLLLFGVSLVDDFASLSATARFVVQFTCAGIFIISVVRAQPWTGSQAVSIGIGAIIVVGIVGQLNIYNFMDGIDGIAGLQAVVAGLAWWILGGSVDATASAALGISIAAGALGFLTLNWPPAKIFMGDAGSTVIGYSFAVLPLLVWVEAKPEIGFFALLVVGVLVVWPFLADGVFTILRRLRKRENIFKAHRSHLYQRLVISGESHQTVTMVYGGLAVVGALLGWLVMCGYSWAIPLSGVVVLALFGLLWRWTVVCEKRASARML